ncbi:MAG: hypothetical protein NXH72_09820 [Hyphomonadaceae bacterium]|nr:hypothetical protein [Hyphomonadaceae bacterium]
MSVELNWDEVLRMVNATKAEFYPVAPIDDKNNAKRFLRVERDGSVTARVFLDIFDMDVRERVICIHYLRHRIRHFYSEDIGINFTSRDAPWDFGVELSTSERFNVEITSIADSKQHFEIAKREERLAHYSKYKFLPVHEAKKLAKLFGDEKIDEYLQAAIAKAKTNSDEIPNPFYAQSDRVFFSGLLNPTTTLTEQIKKAVDSKISKKHSEKESTVLILDNRSSAYDAPDYREAVQQLSSYWSNCPFLEVWFYTGYCSDLDGMNAEFSFAPLKITKEQSDTLRWLYENQINSSTGRVTWQG